MCCAMILTIASSRIRSRDAGPKSLLNFLRHPLIVAIDGLLLLRAHLAGHVLHVDLIAVPQEGGIFPINVRLKAKGLKPQPSQRNLTLRLGTSRGASHRGDEEDHREK